MYNYIINKQLKNYKFLSYSFMFWKGILFKGPYFTGSSEFFNSGHIICRTHVLLTHTQLVNQWVCCRWTEGRTKCHVEIIATEQLLDRISSEHYGVLFFCVWIAVFPLVIILRVSWVKIILSSIWYIWRINFFIHKLLPWKIF